jgi:adenylate cyclase
MMGRYEEAVREHKRNLQKVPTRLGDHIALAATYSLMGREEDARAEAEEVLRLHPKFSVKHFVKQQMYKDQADADRLIAALQKAGLPGTPPLPLPDKPSIALLPFVNIGDPEQEYIADGITEQIITALARNPYLFVIASNSTFTYKGKPVMVQQVSRELGVRYVVEGSVQRSGDRIRITAQLIDATTGEHIWAENYDRNLKDIFALQDEIAIEILRVTMGKLIGMGDLFRSKGTTNVEAYLKFLKAFPLVSTNETDNRLAQQLYEESIALDPEFADAYAMLGLSYCSQAMNGWSKSPGKDLDRAFELAQKAIGLDKALVRPHATLGWYYLLRGKHDEAVAEGKKAVALVPSSAFANFQLGAFLAYADQPEEAILVSENALRLNPFPSDWQLWFLGNAYFVAGRYEEALGNFKKAQERNPDNMWAYFAQAGIYGHLGREEEARAAAKELLRINPKFSVNQYEKMPWYKNRDKWNQHINGLRKAGLR